MAAGITIIPTRWCAAAIELCRSTYTCRAVRRPRKRCCMACCCCKKRFAAPRRLNVEDERDARHARQDRRWRAWSLGDRPRARLWRTDADGAGVRHSFGLAILARRPGLPVLLSHRRYRRRLAKPRAPVRCRLSPAVAET